MSERLARFLKNFRESHVDLYPEQSPLNPGRSLILLDERAFKEKVYHITSVSNLIQRAVPETVDVSFVTDSVEVLRLLAHRRFPLESLRSFLAGDSPAEEREIRIDLFVKGLDGTIYPRDEVLRLIRRGSSSEWEVRLLK